MEALAKAKLVERVRGDWALTKAGNKAAGEWKPSQEELDLTEKEI